MMPDEGGWAAAALTGLVLDEATANFVAANPALGGDPKTLNLASMANHYCVGTYTWTRTVRSVLGVSAQYNVSGQGPAGMVFTFNPSSFSIPAGGTQEIEITVDVTALPVDIAAFGRVLLEPVDVVHPGDMPVVDNHMPVVVIPPPLITVVPVALVVTLVSALPEPTSPPKVVVPDVSTASVRAVPSESTAARVIAASLLVSVVSAPSVAAPV